MKVSNYYFSNFLVNMDKTIDFIPGLSTVSNLFDLFLKYKFLQNKPATEIKSNPYYTHIEEKDSHLSVVLCVPVLGNAIHIVRTLAKAIPFQIAVACEMAGNFSKAEEFYKKSAEQGDGFAYEKIGDLNRLNKLKIATDFVYYQKAMLNYQKAVDHGCKSAWNKLGQTLLHPGFIHPRENQDEMKKMETTLKKAFNCFVTADLIGNDPSATHNLGDCYHFGWGIEKNHKQAFENYQKAADKGHLPSKFMLAIYYTLGYTDINQDLVKAETLLKELKELKFSPAESYLENKKSGIDILIRAGNYYKYFISDDAGSRCTLRAFAFYHEAALKGSWRGEEEVDRMRKYVAFYGTGT